MCQSRPAAATLPIARSVSLLWTEWDERELSKQVKEMAICYDRQQKYSKMHQVVSKNTLSKKKTKTVFETRIWSSSNTHMIACTEEKYTHTHTHIRNSTQACLGDIDRTNARTMWCVSSLQPFALHTVLIYLQIVGISEFFYWTQNQRNTRVTINRGIIEHIWGELSFLVDFIAQLKCSSHHIYCEYSFTNEKLHDLSFFVQLACGLQL